jgi:patatin-like phospholipase/acyl hydrolase
MPVSRLISFDGGGVRGVIPVVVLQRLQRQPRLGDLLAKADLYAGTSTGGVIALSLASSITLDALLDLYQQRASKIFQKTLLDDIRDLDRLIGASYKRKHLVHELHDVLGDRRLDELDKRVVIPAFDLDNASPDPTARTWKPKIFHNFPGLDSDGAQLAYKVATYTASAPTIFPTTDGYIDGGVFATNPAMCALAQTQDPRNEPADRAGLDEIRMLSFGTGHSLQYIDGPSHDWGYVQWIKPLISLMLDGVNGIADYQCRQILRDRYCRFAPTFPPEVNISQDDVSQIPFMVEFANELDLSDITDWLATNW